jgi:serine acetyltransferase
VVGSGVRIGAFAAIGAGAVVTKNIPAHRLVLGVPAREVGWVCICGRPVTTMPTRPQECLHGGVGPG